MVENAAQRKLTAILSADVKGYSKLMGEDDESTVATITAYRTIIAKLIQEHQGRVVDTPGDNILAEFGSALNAVNSAIEIQNSMQIENGKLPENRRMVFRIGINLGDILHKDDCIYGDSVNVAARIESLADPGGICISRGIFDQVKRKIRQGFEYLGERIVKNIPEPVRIYRILLNPEDEGKVIGEPFTRQTKLKKPHAVAIVVLLICSAVMLWMFYSKAPERPPASVEKMAYPLPDEPSIAVLPFDNLSGDPDQDYFGDGITEQIITSLSNVPFLFVIARNSTFAYKNKPDNVQHIAEALGVQYILKGRVQRSNDQIRITVQLIDAIKGNHLWAESYDRQWSNLFALYDEITMKILAELQVKISSEDFGRGSPIKTNNLRAYEKFLRGKSLSYNRNIGDIHEARKLAQEAIQLDSKYGAAYQLLASTYLDEIYLHRVKSRDEYLEKAESLIQQSIEYSGYDSWTHQALSSLYYLKRQFDEAIAEGRKAVESNPNASRSHFVYGMVLSLNGNYEKAILHLHKAIRLDPVAPISYLNQLAFANFYTKNYEKAISLWEQTIQRNPDYYYAHLGLAAAYQLTGKRAKARIAAAELLRVSPSFTVSMLEKRAITSDKEGLALACEALRNAGIPDQSSAARPEKPSIAVLPFDNMSNDPEQAYFSDGISEDLITDLSKISDLLVISRMSSFSYKGKNLKVQQIAEELGVRYVLEGSVRKANERVRINAQLIDASSGHHVWADRYDGDMSDIFTLQDKITRKIIFALALQLTASQQKALSDKGTNNLQAYDEYLKGRQGYRMLTKAGFAEAKIRLEKAVELDPEFARAYAALAVLYWKATHFAAPEHRQGLGLTTRQELVANKAKPQFLVKKAMIKPTALAHGLMSQFYLMRYQHDEALAEIERAVAMDPNNPELYAWMSEIFWLMGKNSEAIESANIGLRLDPNNPATYLRQLGRSYLPDGDLEESLQLLERAKRINPELSGTVALHQSIIYGIQGHIEEARTAYELLIKSRMSPVRSVNDILLYFPFADPKKLDRIADALVKAGAPGKPTEYYRILKENRINGQEVKSLLFGRKIFGIAMSTGKPIGWEWTDNGEFKFTMGKFKTIGNSWIEGDVFFIQFEKMFGGLPYGTVIYRNPDGSSESKNQYLMVSDIGTITRFALAD